MAKRAGTSCGRKPFPPLELIRRRGKLLLPGPGKSFGSRTFNSSGKHRSHQNCDGVSSGVRPLLPLPLSNLSLLCVDPTPDQGAGCPGSAVPRGQTFGPQSKE